MKSITIRLQVVTEQEPDGRWVASLPFLPGCIAFGFTEEGAVANLQAAAREVVGDTGQ